MLSINFLNIGDYMSRIFVGFHGTTKSSADNILKTNDFIFSHGDEEWLGTGVYFFEDFISHAYYWCDKYKCYPLWSILKSDIIADKIVDLNDPETYEQFYQLAKELRTRYHKRKDGKKREIIDAVVLNVMYKTSPYDVARGIFKGITGYDLKNKSFERIQVYPHHIQLCVKNKKCIKSIQEVKTNGH